MWPDLTVTKDHYSKYLLCTVFTLPFSQQDKRLADVLQFS